MSYKKIKYAKSSGNVYKDIGFDDSDERLAKARLAMCIEEIIRTRSLTQIAAAELLGINQPKISALVNGRLAGFSMERLFHFLNLLSQDVEIVIKQKKGRLSIPGKLGVAFR